MRYLVARTRPAPSSVALVLSIMVGAASTLATEGAKAQQLYRWVDEAGEVHYTDKVPPTQADKARSRLTEEGIHVEEVPRAPTPEEIEQAREIERQKAEELKRQAAQAAADERLLKTYATVEDLELARNGKIAAVEAVIQMKRDRVRAETNRLLSLNSKVSELKTAGTPVPDELASDISKTVVSIRDGYAAVVENEYRKQTIRNDFQRTIEHYRELKRLPEPEAPQEQAEAELKLSILVPCKGTAQCNAYWERGNAYVREHSNVRTEVAGPGLLIGFQQDEREDRSLTLSWTQTAADQPVHLYLDVQCKNRQTASLYCTNPTIPQIRDGFQSAVTGSKDR